MRIIISTSPGPHVPTNNLSYKFQRLREKLRHAITSGELSGKLPGERVLARRFHVNAKTLSKALTDLAAEGLLDRSVGRGTYVKGHAPAPTSAKRWLLLCDPQDESNDLVRKVQAAHPLSQIAGERLSMRPSFLNQFNLVIDFASSTPEPFLRDLAVRNIPVIAVGREPRTYSTHSVTMDRALGAFHLARDLMLGGHARIGVIEDRGNTLICDSLRRAAARYAPEATIDAGYASEAVSMVEQGITALICDSAPSAKRTRDALTEAKWNAPDRVSIAAVGYLDGEAPCNGYFLRSHEMIETVLQLAEDASTHRPATLWLTGRFIDMGTMSALRTPPNPPQPTPSRQHPLLTTGDVA